MKKQNISLNVTPSSLPNFGITLADLIESQRLIDTIPETPTHAFCSTYGYQVIKRHFKTETLTTQAISGIHVVHDPDVPRDEIHLGKYVYKGNDLIEKVVMQVIRL